MIKWREALAIDHGPIDRDHKQLIAIVNEFYVAAEQGAGRPVLVAALRRLTRYTREHFAREEALQARIGYGDRAAHAKEHGRILDRLQGIVVAMENQPLEATRQQTMDLVRHWIVDHVIGHDLHLRPAIDAYKNRLVPAGPEAAALEEDDEEYWSI